MTHTQTLHRLSPLRVAAFIAMVALPLPFFGQSTCGQSADLHPCAQTTAAAEPRDRIAATVHRIVVDSLGPYSLLMAIAVAGMHQATNNPPEWHQGAVGLSRRFGSNLGITFTSNAARYGLTAATNLDINFRKCACTGIWPRLEHAVIGTAVAHDRTSGHAVLSLPNLVAPYAATNAAVFGWYPSRYNAEDAFRMGNYNLLGTVGTNIAIEFVPNKAWQALRHIHLSTSRMP